MMKWSVLLLSIMILLLSTMILHDHFKGDIPHLGQELNGVGDGSPSSKGAMPTSSMCPGESRRPLRAAAVSF